MKRKNFEIVIRADGQIDLDLLNGDGKSCERDIDDLAAALGAEPQSRRKKPEYWHVGITERVKVEGN